MGRHAAHSFLRGLVRGAEEGTNELKRWRDFTPADSECQWWCQWSNSLWNLGASFSHGSYLRPETESVAAFPKNKERGDFDQTTFAQDLSFAWHHFQLWEEVFFTRFEVPNVGDADVMAYYVEAKYTLTPKLFAAVRWNQQFFAQVPDGAGGEAVWDRDAWRVDTAIGWLFSRHLQAKLQYSYNHQRGTLQQGEQLVAGQVTVKF